MAFTGTITKVVQQPGDSPVVKLYGNYVNTGGSTGGELTMTGMTNAAGSDATAIIAGLSKILAFVPIPAAQSVTVPSVAIAYDTTVDADKVTLTTVADEDGAFVLDAVKSKS